MSRCYQPSIKPAEYRASPAPRSKTGNKFGRFHEPTSKSARVSCMCLKQVARTLQVAFKVMLMAADVVSRHNAGASGAIQEFDVAAFHLNYPTLIADRSRNPSRPFAKCSRLTTYTYSIAGRGTATRIVSNGAHRREQFPLQASRCSVKQSSIKHFSVEQSSVSISQPFG
ncbi:hypothetical protein EJ03DRAFT_165323 [Teratosphaeria nubilosa]|uniref:Uncharacterized protein n=1 Tax=Teratosphaeria nubilosa TaxID=161662 RepID=A0A6G1L2R4_9PEZI|nr:hypothetical protein EJ03DRAFT_165323 [Teratosphaeria nubilosa]